MESNANIGKIIKRQRIITTEHQMSSALDISPVVDIMAGEVTLFLAPAFAKL